MISKDDKNPDDTKRALDTLRPEFIAGSNATLSRSGNELIIKWEDYYMKRQHQVLENLFLKLSAQQGLPFLGGLKLKFEIAPPRPEEFCNQFKRGILEF